MKPGKDTLWSTDIFGTSLSRAPEPSVTPDLGGVSARVAPGAAAAARAPAPPPVNPERERAYLRFGRPTLQMLATREGREARFSEIRDFLAARDPDFDFDDLRRALSELERREAVEIAERDPRGGDHLYRLTKIGWVLAA
jgi:hypothetical protein